MFACKVSSFFLFFFFLEDDSFSSKEDGSGSQGPLCSDDACSGISRFSTKSMCADDEKVSPIRGGLWNFYLLRWYPIGKNGK